MYNVLLERAAEKELGKLPEDAHDRVIAAPRGLSRNPRPPGSRKLMETKNDWRIRVGDYRIFYEIADVIRIVRVHRIRHRGDAYRGKGGK